MGFNEEMKADTKAGELMDKQDELQEEVNALKILQKLGYDKIMKDNFWTEIDFEILERKAKIETLDLRVRKELDKLPSMEYKVVKYKICEEENEE